MSNNEQVTKYLIEKNMTISFMESCTSGLLASMFTDTEGASAVFKGSFVTYSNEAKVAAGVAPEIIEKYSVYSKECAAAMADTVKTVNKVDVAVGVTGTTGNVDPLNADSSVEGEVFYCIIIRDEAYDFHLKTDVNGLSRNRIKQIYADAVYKSLKELILG